MLRRQFLTLAGAGATSVFFIPLKALYTREAKGDSAWARLWATKKDPNGLLDLPTGFQYRAFLG